MKTERKKIFCGPLKVLKNISRSINICLKYFMTPTRTTGPLSYILNVRSLTRKASLSKNKYDFGVFCPSSFVKYLKSVLDKWLISICWSFYFFEIFIIKEYLGFSLIFLGTAKKESVIKTKAMSRFLFLINNSVDID